VFQKGLKYLSNNKAEKALACFKKCTETKEVLTNMGTCYRLLGNDEKAQNLYIRALNKNVPFLDNSFADSYPVALNNLSLIAYTYEDDELAAKLLLNALEQDPLYYDAIWNLANTRLRQYFSGKYSDLKTCWELYDYRFKRANPVGLKNTKKDLIMWDGRPVDKIVVLAEQGFGDQMMFGRYLHKLPADKVYVQCHPRARALFGDIYECVNDPADCDAEYGVPFCSLGKFFYEDIPSLEWLSDKYISKLKDGKMDVGVTWSGSHTHVNNKYRSTTPNYFRGLADICNLYTLNPTEAGTAGFTALRSGGWHESLEELSKLDLVITVDTSIAHLCGSVGMPCWVLMGLKNNDFRWGDSSCGFDNKWYKSVRVFRNNGSWSDVFTEVRNELIKYKYSLGCV
jgi:hypothetical protein